AALGSTPSAVARTVMSRSVTIPTTRFPSTTGSGPTSRSFIVRAASARVVSAPTTTASGVITSETRIFHLQDVRGCNSTLAGLVDVEAVVEGLEADVQDLGGLALVAAEPLERGQDELPFRLRNRRAHAQGQVEPELLAAAEREAVERHLAVRA